MTKYTQATIEEMKERLYCFMVEISQYKDNWRLRAEEKHLLDSACSDLNIVVENLRDYEKEGM